MRRKSLVAVLTVFLLNACVHALGQTRVPQFKDYPAGEIYRGPTASLVLKRDDLVFRTRLRSAAQNLKSNFAGHYILTAWGCGAQCVMGAVIDAKTGRVHWWNFSVVAGDSTQMTNSIRLNSVPTVA